ncbi:MAG: DUF4367 domain-containing protein [Eubacteriales bacterium]|nr:DUF4367 domain-containing protein [Eubacteriales bacterium]
MKKLLVIAMMGIMAVSAVGCGASKDDQKIQSEAKTETEIVQIPSDFVEAASLDAAKDIAGFTMTAPDTVDGYTEKNISVLDLEDKMIQVIYSQDEKELVIRKEAMGSDGVKDISGDYTEYAEKNEFDVNGQKITASGSEGEIYTAVWADDNYNYSVGSTDGLTQDSLKELVSKIQ